MWTSAPSLWVHVAQALGFSVTFMQTSDPAFDAFMASFVPEQESVTPGAASGVAPDSSYGGGRGGLPSVDVVFTDYTILSSLSEDHWTQHHVPHLVMVDKSHVLRTREGWCVRQVAFRHASVGGSTAALYSLALLAPHATLSEVEDPPPMITQPWIPMRSMLEGVTSAAPLGGNLAQLLTKPLPLSDPYPVVNVLRLLHSSGLAHRYVSTAKVIVPCVFHPDGLGVRLLLCGTLQF